MAKEDGFTVPPGSLCAILERYVPSELLDGGVADGTWSFDDKRSDVASSRCVYRSAKPHAGEYYYMIVDNAGVSYATEA